MAGAVDLSALKERATRQAAARNSPPPAAQNSETPGAVADPSLVFDVTEESFEADVIQKSFQVLVVVNLGAQWSEPCQQLTSNLERLAQEGQGKWVLAKVDVEQQPRVAQAFGAESIPTVIALAQGQPVHAFSGAQDDAKLREWLGELHKAVGSKLPGIQVQGAEQPQEVPADPRFVEAENALEQGDFAAAEVAYQRILDAEPRNSEAKAGLNHSRFLLRVRSLNPNALEIADSAPHDVAAQLEAADVEVVSQRPERAFARLTAVVRDSAGDDRSLARERLLSLLEMFDPTDPMVLQARRNLAAALY
ncbi:tetratricopeptide repeat protein [Hoyosella rhizosphaerae]|uniref:Co-chaperone YbbN n=1 Tax=Hoyosella rhizosphaerae TaxID=1755582 RepID=A0A916X7H3_9ACTN|nr:tetratricopeptide repeat protein [Hoyosella rhizosphaerae]GGC51765.1 co-chaperone YbbN [Hoyosella rhizosphaerae]